MRQTRISLTRVTIALICVGIVMIYSASCVNALENYKDSMYYLKRHLFFLCLGLGAVAWVLMFDYRQIQPHARTILMVSIALLILVLIPHFGKESYGARRWFKLGIFHFHPSAGVFKK